MTVHGDKDVLDAGKSGHARLRVISEIHDERTRALLLDTGSRPAPRSALTRSESTSADQIAEATELAEGKIRLGVGSVYERWLRDFGCDQAQGYDVARPMPAQPRTGGYSTAETRRLLYTASRTSRPCTVSAA